MLTKILAAKRAARSGASTVIASGREPDVLTRLAAGEDIGTSLIAEHGLARRAQAVARRPRAARRAPDARRGRRARASCATARACCRSASTAVDGDFERGAVVGCVDADGREIARGLVNYTAQETARILRRPSSEIESILGYVDETELIHRDNMVLLG